jgi:hypothetical protein
VRCAHAAAERSRSAAREVCFIGFQVAETRTPGHPGRACHPSGRAVRYSRMNLRGFSGIPFTRTS